MKIYIKSNFVVPGIENQEWIDLRSEMTLQQFLQNLSMMSSSRVEYVRPNAKTLDPDDWEVNVNDIPYQDCKEGLETLLKNEDTVTIRIKAFGGG